MATITVPRDPRTARRVANTLNEIPDAQLACRAGRHMWPLDDLEAGKPLPRGLRADRGQLLDECRRCGKTRVIDLLPGNIFDVGASYGYKDPKDWVRLGQDLDVTKRDLRAHNIARNADRLFR